MLSEIANSLKTGVFSVKRTFREFCANLELLQTPFLSRFVKKNYLTLQQKNGKKFGIIVKYLYFCIRDIVPWAV